MVMVLVKSAKKEHTFILLIQTHLSMIVLHFRWIGLLIYKVVFDFKNIQPDIIDVIQEN